MNKKIGFIGCGNMGEAMLKGIIDSFDNTDSIYVFEKNKDRQKELKEKYKVNISSTPAELVSSSEMILVAVKPNIFSLVMDEIKSVVDDSKVIISIAAGVTIAAIEKGLGDKAKIIRTMPNTPAFVGLGMTSMSPNKNVTSEEALIAKQILEGFGEVEEISETLIHSVIGVSGSAPAYVFMFIEAMADAAVLEGMPRDKAYKFASQAVMGSAKMVLETGKHPGVLKDMVCSPGGTTIAAVAELEKTGFRSSIISGIRKCMKKSKEMSK